MQLVRAFFGLRTVYFKQTAGQIVFVWFWVSLGAGFAVLLASRLRLPPYIYVTGGAVLGYALLRTVIRTALVNRYLRQFPQSLLAFPAALAGGSSAHLELNKVDTIRPVAVHGNAKVFLAMFNFYTHTKYGDFLARQAYYTVIEVPLVRRLPHILFDSRVAKKRQFRYIYLKVQRISVQAPFDDIFDTYVPQTYAIDSLSFITPEVMELMLEARSCDIEIVGDKLLLYGPLLGTEDVTAVAAKASAIAGQLNDNIDTYRDDRLTGQERVANVTLFARSLLKSPVQHVVLAAVFGAITTGIVVAALLAEPDSRGDVLFNTLSFIVYGGLIANAAAAHKIIRENRRAYTAAFPRAAQSIRR